MIQFMLAALLSNFSLFAAPKPELVYGEAGKNCGAGGILIAKNIPPTVSVVCKPIDPNGTATWVVLQKAESGAWSVIDRYEQLGPGNSFSLQLSATSDRTIYLAGNARAANGDRYWLVRRGLNGGATWESLPPFDTAAPSPGWGTTCLEHQRELLCAGNQVFGDVWETRVWKSTAPFTTWDKFSSFALEGVSTFANFFLKDNHDNLYLSGYNADDDSLHKSFVQKSEDGGKTWTLLDLHAVNTGPEVRTVAMSASVNARGEIWTAGYFTAPNLEGRQGIIRKYDPFLRSWSDKGVFRDNSPGGRVTGEAILSSGHDTFSCLNISQPGEVSQMRFLHQRRGHDNWQTKFDSKGSHGLGANCVSTALVKWGNHRLALGGSQKKPNGESEYFLLRFKP